jgi:hypothetical protein
MVISSKIRSFCIYTTQIRSPPNLLGAKQTKSKSRAQSFPLYLSVASTATKFQTFPFTCVTSSTRFSHLGNSSAKIEPRVSTFEHHCLLVMRNINKAINFTTHALQDFSILRKCHHLFTEHKFIADLYTIWERTSNESLQINNLLAGRVTMLGGLMMG